MNREALESRFGLAVVHCDRAFAPTGEPFAVLKDGGFVGFDEAEAAARQAFDTYAVDREGTLYWRTPPEVIKRNPHGWTFYMRLLISNKGT